MAAQSDESVGVEVRNWRAAVCFGDYCERDSTMLWKLDFSCFGHLGSEVTVNETGSRDATDCLLR